MSQAPPDCPNCGKPMKHSGTSTEGVKRYICPPCSGMKR